MSENVETSTPTKARKHRRTIVGVVRVANKTPKTIKVEVRYLVKHAKYGKYMRRTSHLRAHDEKSEAHVGDRVEVMECRPISKSKTWRLVKVLEAAPQE